MKISNTSSRWTWTGIALALVAGAPVIADDTELLLVTPSNASPFNANILLIVDSSGSMGTEEDTNAPYDSTTTYAGSCDTTKFYWNDVGIVPACDASNTRYFDKTAFVCAKADRQIDGIGLFQGVMVQYRADATGATKWDTIEPGNSTDMVECSDDSGFDGDGALVYAQAGSNMPEYTNDPTREVAWGSFPTSETYTVYDGNYINWRDNPTPVKMTRLAMVQTAAKITMASINSANIGIMRFNEFDGGAVIKAMTDLDANRASLDAVIDGIVADGRTPLAETLYESALYWLGADAHYGELFNENPTDPAALVSTGPEKYLAPDSPVCTKNYNVLLTDGEPVDDMDAQTLAPTLPNFTAKLGRTACTGTNMGDCLDDISEYLSIPDIDSNQAGDQFVTTHTIGFTIDLPILKQAAEVSGGNYYLADDVESLTLALLQIFKSANEQALAFTAPTVAVNAFNRTRNLNDLYMTVFRAKNKVHWPGNLKKYRIANQVITDANGVAAVDAATGFFKDTAQSYWTIGGADGKEIELGGAANMLPDPTTRNVFTNNGSSNDLTDTSNAVTPSNSAAFTLADFGLSGSAAEPSLDELIRWTRGEDMRDADSNPATTQRNVMGDPLHSQPAAVVYGGAAGSEEVVVFAATNDGFLHAVDGQTGVELWSFIPKELLSDMTKLYYDPDANAKHYGIDGDIVPVVADRDGNGIIDGSDFVYILFGLRRGGNSYFALDVTDKNNPQLKWQVTPAGGGQSWSTPVVAKVDVTGAGMNADKAAVIIGAGYDTVHDTNAFPTSADNSGAGVMMLDLETGAELWRAGRDASADLQLANMTRAFPTQIRVIDVNGDKLADRMYASDVGGQVWRFDIYNGQAPAGLVTGGVIAQIGAEGIASPSAADTRRVYNSPDVSIFDDPVQERRYISVNIGTGYRAHPLDNTASDRFYSLRDPDVFKQLSQVEYDSYNVATDADFVEVSGQVQTVIGPTDRGWRFTLPGTQKVLADSLTFNNSVFFVGFSPDVQALSDCQVTVGKNFLYEVSVINGDPVVNNLDTLDPADADDAREEALQQGGIAPSPTILFPSPDDPNCTGAACSPPPIFCVGAECNPPDFGNNPVRTLWNQDGVN